MAMTPEERAEFDTLRGEVRRLSELVSAPQGAAARIPIRAVDLPPHFHEVDRVDIRSLKGGFTILDATPSQVAEEGKCILYSVGGSAYRVAFKVNEVWRTAALS